MLTLNRCTFGKYVRRHYTWQDKGYVFSGAVKAGQKFIRTVDEIVNG